MHLLGELYKFRNLYNWKIQKNRIVYVHPGEDFIYLHVLRVLSAREENEMANIVKNIERQTFSLVIDNVLKSMRKDREAALLKIVDLAQKFMGNNFSPEAYEGARKMIKNPDAKWMR